MCSVCIYTVQIKISDIYILRYVQKQCFNRAGIFSSLYFLFAAESTKSVIYSVVEGMLHCRLMFLLTRPWTSQDISYVIGRKWTCAIKCISAVSEAELCRIFLLRGTHWNSMGTLVIRVGARWRRSVTLLQFSIYFYLTGNKFVFIKCISLSTVCSTEHSKRSARIYKSCTKAT